MSARLVDTHCHLQAKRFEEDREEVLRRSLDKLAWLVVIGDDIPSSREAVDLVRDRVHAAVGVHPYYAKDFDEEMLDNLRTLAQQPGVVALGEIGLDYFNEYSPRAAQKIVFRRQLELACELRLPVVIHNRDADDDTLPILTEFAQDLPGCILHCFGSAATFAESYVKLGFYVSFAGNVTFPKADALRESALAVPLDKLLVETDAPFLAPVPLRGKRCEPWHVEHTAAGLVELRGVTLEDFVRQTTLNACTVYNISTDSGTPV